MADQCIVCLESLDLQPLAVLDHSSVSAGVAAAASDATAANGSTVADAVLPATAAPAKEIAAGPATAAAAATTLNAAGDDNSIAEIQICGHVLHDACLREWTGKANSCPICRQTFHLVNVWDRVGGTKLSSYTVEDKRQIAEFDAQAWLDENPEDIEPARPCPICRSTDHEEVLLLCDSCDTPYHTHCIGLDCIPRGHWFCLECSHDAAALLEAEVADPDAGLTRLAGSSDRRSDYLPRTQATMRRARQRARSDEWQGAWGQIAGHVFDALDIDLDNHDDDEALQNYRQSQRRRERERQAYQRWQQRLNIASRLGAHDVFANNLPRALAQQAQQTPPPPQETPEEKEAWGALEKAMEADVPSGTTPPNRRKRKSSSVTASPREPAPEPERRLKRPRTRRAPQASETAEASSSHQHQNGTSSSAAPMGIHEAPHQTHHDATPDVAAPGVTAPSFLSSLLREVEMTQPSDDENVRAVLGTSKAPVEHSSPATSPSPSGYSSPRALSATPPPRNMNERPGSPLTLTSRIEPIYPRANFPPPRNGSDSSDSESRPRPQTRPSRQNSHGRSPEVHSPELRRPRPRRQHPGDANARHGVGSPDSSPTRASPTRTTLSLGTKEAISAIIKAALKPHYRSGHINTDQYTAINRDLSRKLYTEVSDVGLDDDTKRRCETLASKEVARAVADLRV